MVAEEQVREFVEALASEFSPQRVILFGSRGRGDFSGDSDVDLLVIMQTDKAELQQALDIRLRLPRSFPWIFSSRRPGKSNDESPSTIPS